MFNTILNQYDRIHTLERLMNEIKTKGTISMESADMLERLVPGEIGAIDSNILFELDESEEGLPVAMEAGLSGLSKVKMAFIIAIIAFISRYLLSLNQNTYSFSSGGGSGGGGWGGSAPPKFESNAAPTSPQLNQEITDYQKLLAQDIESLHKEFNETLKLFLVSPISNNIISGMTNNSSVKKLVKIITHLIKDNGGGKPITAKGFNLFAEGAAAGTHLHAAQWSAFVNTDEKSEGKVTAEQLKQLPGVLSIILKNYTPTDVLTSYYTEDANEKDQKYKMIKTIESLGVPHFVLDPDSRKHTLEFIGLISSMVSTSSSLTNIMDEIKSVVTNPRQEFIDANEGLSFSSPLWQWLARNLGVNDSTSTVVKTYITKLTPIIGPQTDWGDTQYYNTMTRAKVLKQFVKASLDGDGGMGEIKPTEVIKIEGAKNLGELLWSKNHDAFTKLFDGVLEPLQKVNEVLADHDRDIENLSNTCKELETALTQAIAHLKNDALKNVSKNERKQDAQAIRNIQHSEEVKLSSDNLDADSTDPTIARKQLPHMLTLISGLIQMLLMTVAAAAKYNIEMTKLAENRVNLVIGKGQEIASNYAKLIKTMNDIMKESQ